MASPAMSVVHTPRTPHTPSRPGQQQLVDGRTYAMWNCLPERTKIGSIFGANMCALDVFRHISTSHPFHLVIEAKTPSQWRPAMYDPVPSERFHMTNLEMTSLQIPAVVRPAAHRTRIKILAKSFTDEAILAASFAKPEKRPPSTAATNTTTTASSSSAATNGLPLTQASLGMALATSQAQAPISSFARAMFADPTGSGDAAPPVGEGAFDLAPATTSGTGSTGSAPGAGAGAGGVTLATVRFVGASPTAGDPKSTKKKAPPPVPLAERLGVDPILLPAASGGVRIKPGTGLVQRKKPKLGGVYGHFFHELPPAVRDLIMQRVTDNKKRIQKESFLSPEQVHARSSLPFSSHGGRTPSHSLILPFLFVDRGTEEESVAAGNEKRRNGFFHEPRRHRRDIFPQGIDQVGEGLLPTGHHVFQNAGQSGRRPGARVRRRHGDGTRNDRRNLHCRAKIRKDCGAATTIAAGDVVPPRGPAAVADEIRGVDDSTRGAGAVRAAVLRHVQETLPVGCVPHPVGVSLRQDATLGPEVAVPDVPVDAVGVAADQAVCQQHPASDARPQVTHRDIVGGM